MNKQHYGTEGPLGFPQTDKQALALDSILKALPKDSAFGYRKLVTPQATTEVSHAERSDVSWISTEDPDRQKDIVLSRGMNDSQFTLNPIVTFNHNYYQPPVGRSLWRKKVTATYGVAGIKAKTVFPAKPPQWPEGEKWMPDLCFGLVQQQLMNGKSIGFLPLKVREPNDQERQSHGKKADSIIEEWLLLEYACVYLPAQQNAVVEEVSKSLLAALGIETKSSEPPPEPKPPETFTSWSEIEKAISRRLSLTNWSEVAEKAMTEEIAKMQGRVA